MEWYEDLYNRQIYLDLYAEADTELAQQEVTQLIALLGLTNPQTILDVCCGYGRHAIALAKRGHQVTGIDFSQRQLAEAAKRVAQAGVAITLVQEDVRSMAFPAQFDLVLNLFTSFGFFQTEADHLTMLAKMAQATKPGGRLVIDLWNREQVIRTLTPQQVEERPGGIRVEKRWAFDAWNGRINWTNTVIFPNSNTENWDHSVRAYTLIELRQMLAQAGFEVVDVYGHFDGRAYTLEAPNLVLIATKM